CERGCVERIGFGDRQVLDDVLAKVEIGRTAGDVEPPSPRWSSDRRHPYELRVNGGFLAAEARRVAADGTQPSEIQRMRHLGGDGSAGGFAQVRHVYRERQLTPQPYAAGDIEFGRRLDAISRIDRARFHVLRGAHGIAEFCGGGTIPTA